MSSDRNEVPVLIVSDVDGVEGVDEVAGGTSVQSQTPSFATRQKRLIDPSEFMPPDTIEVAGDVQVC